MQWRQGTAAHGTVKLAGYGVKLVASRTSLRSRTELNIGIKSYVTNATTSKL